MTVLELSPKAEEPIAVEARALVLDAMMTALVHTLRQQAVLSDEALAEMLDLTEDNVMAAVGAAAADRPVSAAMVAQACRSVIGGLRIVCDAPGITPREGGCSSK